MAVATAKHLRLLRPLVLCALAASLGGSAWGVYLLTRMQLWSGRIELTWIQAHGQLQVFGFLVPFVAGFALFLVPRIAGGRPAQPAWLARIAVVALGTGVAGALAAPLAGPGPLRWASAAAVGIGTTAAALALHLPLAAHAQAIGGRARAGYLWLLQLGLLFLVLGGLADATALVRAAHDAYRLVDDPLAGAAWRFEVEGFAVGLAFAVAARTFAGFLGIDPRTAYPAATSAYQRSRRSDRAFWLATLGWGTSVVVTAAAEALGNATAQAIGDVLFGTAAIVFAFRLGLARRGTLAIDRSLDPRFALGARTAFALLVVAALVGGLAGLATLMHAAVAVAWLDARRHLLTLGFLLTLIAAMAGRLAPGYAGRPLAAPALRTFAMIAFPASALLRACEGAAAQWGVRALWVASAASGPLAGAAFLALVGSVGATLLTAPAPR